MPPPKDLPKLISLTQTTQTLLAHFQTSLAPPTNKASTSSSNEAPDLPNGPLTAIHAATTLLKSHTTTLSLLLLTPPFTPSALIAKIGDVTSGALSGMVAAASHAPSAGSRDDLGQIMRGEMREAVKRVVAAWSGVLRQVLAMAEARRELAGKDAGPSEAERRDVLAATGMVWDVCDRVLRLCDGGVVELVLKKAQQLRAVLLDAVEEMKEWGEDVASDSEEEEDKAEGSGGEDDGFGDEDDFFGANNKIGKGDVELKVLLDRSVKKLKMVAIMYQAVGKRRLNTFPAVRGSNPASAVAMDGGDGIDTPAQRLDKLMHILKTIPESVDDLASTFYELEQEEAEVALKKVCDEAKSAVQMMEKSWTGTDDEFTAWAAKWTQALDLV